MARQKKQAGGGVPEWMVTFGDLMALLACFFVLIRTSEHEAGWQSKFLAALRARPEVLEAHRLAGDIDYILKVRVRNARAYDEFYQALISEVHIYNVTALLSAQFRIEPVTMAVSLICLRLIAMSRKSRPRMIRLR